MCEHRHGGPCGDYKQALRAHSCAVYHSRDSVVSQFENRRTRKAFASHAILTTRSSSNPSGSISARIWLMGILSVPKLVLGNRRGLTQSASDLRICSIEAHRHAAVRRYKCDRHGSSEKRPARTMTRAGCSGKNKIGRQRSAPMEKTTAAYPKFASAWLSLGMLQVLAHNEASRA